MSSSVVMQSVQDVVESMKNRVIHNYIAPGLDSFLLNREDCKVRLFEMTRSQEMYITPHNHRFDFACCVLEGEVTHYTYSQLGGGYMTGTLEELGSNPHYQPYQINEFVPSVKVPGANSSKFILNTLGYSLFKRNKNRYFPKDWYTLTRDQFHAIDFAEGTKVLFLEGTNARATSYFLEPVVNGKVISLFQIPDWMYQP